MTQIAADVMDMPLQNVRFELSDSSFPQAPPQYGSHTTAAVGSAVHDVCMALKQRLGQLAVNRKGSVFYNVRPGELIFEGGSIRHNGGRD